MPRNLFISLTHSDTAIAEALRDAIDSLFGDFLKVHFSTSKGIETGISSGEDWFQWIVDRVVDCDFALILVTPSSVHKPWILWEAGAVAGAALASKSEQAVRKVRPLVYQLPTDMIPSPIRDSKMQFRRGDSASDVRKLFQEILAQYRRGSDLGDDRVTEFGERLKGVVETYVTSVQSTLLDAPAVPTHAMLEEWRQRLDDLLAQNRASEVRHLHDWMEIAFGRDREARPRPLDLQIHTRLGQLYMNARDYDRAIAQFELARELSPRDIFVLRRLGQAYLERQQRDRAQQVLDRIRQLDADAFQHNAECAALAGRYYRSGGDAGAAADIYRSALLQNPESYYLATLLAEALLEQRDIAAATTAYRRVGEIIGKLNESNIWTHASAANAYLFVGDNESLVRELSALRQLRPSADQLSSVERGLKNSAEHAPDGPAQLSIALRTLRA